MFERFLKDPKALARHRNGPLAEERRRYLAHLAKQQAKRETLKSIANSLLAIAEALHLDQRSSELTSPEEVDAEVHRWIHRPRPRRFNKQHIAVRNRVLCWLTFVGRLQLPPAVQRPYADEVTRFADYLLRERGLSRRKRSITAVARFMISSGKSTWGVDVSRR